MSSYDTVTPRGEGEWYSICNLLTATLPHLQSSLVDYNVSLTDALESPIKKIMQSAVHLQPSLVQLQPGVDSKQYVIVAAAAFTLPTVPNACSISEPQVSGGSSNHLKNEESGGSTTCRPHPTPSTACTALTMSGTDLTGPPSKMVAREQSGEEKGSG